MKRIKVLVDACADIPKAWRDEYDIDYACLSLIWEGKGEVPADCDWQFYSPKEFYDAVRAATPIKSNQVTAEEFERLYTKYLDEGCDIIYIGCSSALSGSYSMGATTAKRMMEQRPGSKIFCIDPKVASGGQAMLAVSAAKWAAEGKSVEEVAKLTEEKSRHAFQVGTIDTLTYLKRAGRVKASAAFFGNLFGIKPIIVNDINGANAAIAKKKGRQNAVDTCIDMLKDVMCYDGQPYPVEEQTVFIGHADCIDTAEYCKAKIMELIKPKDVVINYIGPCIGASVGPTMFGLYAFGKTAEERTTFGE